MALTNRESDPLTCDDPANVPSKRRAGRPPKTATMDESAGSPVPTPGDVPLGITSRALSVGAPPFTSEQALDQVATADYDVVPLERRLGLRARLILEEALRETKGWTKKERVDAALKTITTIEGARGHLWITPTVGEIKSEEDVLREKRRVEERLHRLLGHTPGGQVKADVVSAALDIMDAQVVPTNGDRDV